MKLFHSAIALGCITAAGAVFAAGEMPEASPAAAGHDAAIALTNWQPQSMSSKTAKPGTKAATDTTTIFRPVPICRLLDTRVGASAAITPNAPYNPNTRHTIAAAGKCGIPSIGTVAGLSVSFHVYNYTVNNGGYITFLTVGAAIAGTNAVLNPGAQWTAATANVGTLDDTGNFDIYIANSQVDVIVDINGYYQDFGLSGSQALDVGASGLDAHGTGSWVFAGVNDGNGIGLYGYSNGTGPGVNATNTTGGPALTIGLGSVHAAGAGINTNTFAFIHRVVASNYPTGTLCGGFNTYTAIVNPMLNGDGNAIVLVTPRYVSGAGQSEPTNLVVAEYYPTNSCSPAVPAGTWFLRQPSGNFTAGMDFDILVIKN